MTAELPRLPALAAASPCDGCQLAAMCARDLLACRQFGLFVLGKRWADGPRFPTARRFAKIYATDGDDDDAIVRMREQHRKTMRLRGTRPGRRSSREVEATC